MLKKLKNFLNSRARRKAAEKMPRDEDGKFIRTPAPAPVVAPSATKAPAKKAPAKKAPAAKKAAAPKKK